MVKYCIGIDIGGTSVKFGLFTTEGELLEKWSVPTNLTKGEDYILENIVQSVKQKLNNKLIEMKQIIGAGVGVPGQVSKDGTVLFAENLGWKNIPVVEKLKKMLGFSVKVENDANLAALGEVWKGSGRNCHSMMFITLGTGIGCGIIINDKILSGVDGAAGEIGHIHIEDNMEKQCNCGRYGCLEQFASATGVCWMCEKLLQSTKTSSVLRGKEVSSRSVFDAASKGDALAVQVVDQFGMYLGKALAMCTCVVNPGLIVIGGGVSLAGKIILDYVEKYYRIYSYPPCEKTEFRLASLGSDAGIFGGAGLIIKQN